MDADDLTEHSKKTRDGIERQVFATCTCVLSLYVVHMHRSVRKLKYKNLDTHTHLLTIFWGDERELTAERHLQALATTENR
tara:strand:- start:318 stop:560 length:243 start_codon:yes stop_codon:yes gene_type:complete